MNTTYEAVVGENKYQIIIPSNAHLGEAYDVMFKFLSIIAEQAKATTDTLKPKDTPVPEVKADVVS